MLKFLLQQTGNISFAWQRNLLCPSIKEVMTHVLTGDTTFDSCP